MTEPHVGYSKNQIAQAVLDTERDTNPTNAVVIDAVARFCPSVGTADAYEFDALADDYLC